MLDDTNMKGETDPVSYVQAKYDDFIFAETGKNKLSALWHVSQLIHLLPDERVKEVIHIAKKSPDFGVRFEACYLSGRWLRRFVLRFAVASGVLFVLCALFVIIGSVCKWPFELIFSVCYVLGAFGIEVTLATLILHWKQKVVTKNGI